MKPKAERERAPVGLAFGGCQMRRAQAKRAQPRRISDYSRPKVEVSSSLFTQAMRPQQERRPSAPEVCPEGRSAGSAA